MRNAAEVKLAAAGHWRDILVGVGGIEPALLDGRHHPCPMCGGTDRFRALDDFEQSGALFCNRCFSSKNGDGIAAVQWLTGMGFREALAAINEQLGLNGKAHRSNGHQASANGKPRIVATYDYRDERGQLLYQVVRFDPKDFRQRRPKPAGGWQWTVKGLRLVPYRLPELLAADPAELVFICEGEKDCDRLAGLGLVATCNVGGAGKWRPDFAEHFRGRRVVVLPDNDDPGRKHAHEVAQSLSGVAASVKVVELPGLPAKGDISDWLGTGGTVEELLRLVEEAAEWKPATRTDEDSWGADGGVIAGLANARMDRDEDGQEHVIPLTMSEVIAETVKVTDDWPRRVGNALFIHDRNGVANLDCPAALFGWLARSSGIVNWRRGNGCITKEEFFAELRRTATAYEAIEELPHEPPIVGHYYACEPMKPGDGAALEAFLDFFCPQTDLDRQLYKAAVMTPLWGGPPGSRPAFLFTASTGRGRGKSTAAMLLAKVFGGYIDISANEDIGVVKQRLLSPEAARLRVALLDNVKSSRFSWAELESLITTSDVSGKRMYVGDARRPNLVTWLITLNGASLSTDMAQRVVEIQFDEPRYTESWEGDVNEFLRCHRLEIIADVIGLLQKPPMKMRRHSRWATWEGQVLARMDCPDECLDMILERRSACDVEQEESEILEDYFAARLSALGYNPDTDDVFIPTEITMQWFNAATGDKKKAVGVTRAIKQLQDEGRIWRLTYYRGGKGGERGTRWVGEHADASEPTQWDLAYRIAKRLESGEFR